MPIDYRSVYAQIVKFAQSAPKIYKKREERREHVREVLAAQQERQDDLRQLTNLAAQIYTPWRSAAPTDEALTLALDPPEDAEVAQAVILAADGSQIEPNPHADLYFALVNVGVVVMSTTLTPRTHIITTLWTPEDLEQHTPPISLQRDLQERRILAEIVGALRQDTTLEAFGEKWASFAADIPADAPVLALTDGPLELWGAKEEEGGNFRRALNAYVESLKRLAKARAIAAGYVDKPHANLVVNMLALAALQQPPDREAVRRIAQGNFEDFRGVSDADLFRTLLGPGQRSAVFALQSQSRADYTGDLALHFFYFNPSPDPEQPVVARVEIPAWVAQDPDALELLHAALLWQSRRVPHVPYPYILHRAHEVAVVRREDREAIAGWMRQQLLLHGVSPGRISSKQKMKDLSR